MRERVFDPGVKAMRLPFAQTDPYAKKQECEGHDDNAEGLSMQGKCSGGSQRHSRKPQGADAMQMSGIGEPA